MHAFCADPAQRTAMIAMAEAIAAALRAGGKLLVAGNGGSAGDAQHIAGEFVSRLMYDRAPLPAIALTTDSSAMLAIGNDYGFVHIFERQVRALGRPGDVLLGISTSGRSPNVLAALAAARARGHGDARPGRRRAGTDGRDVRHRAARALGLDAADPADPHHRRPSGVRAGRTGALPTA